MHRLHYSTESRNDLAKIKEYISVEFDNPTAAARMVAYIVKRIRGLRQFPEMGALLSSIVDVNSNYRYLVCKNYLVFYRIDVSDIYIIRVLYGGRDYISVLFGDLHQDEEIG
ncbi:MAG: type II toxin-antitoxin system RelE/ParE family toxin [Oscillospiraceae bacterium]|nr:type II toxin-antitoxin system RelE/ParE family toxin [Oscillospiraceae bacterium]